MSDTIPPQKAAMVDFFPRLPISTPVQLFVLP